MTYRGAYFGPEGFEKAPHVPIAILCLPRASFVGVMLEWV